MQTCPAAAWPKMNANFLGACGATHIAWDAADGAVRMARSRAARVALVSVQVAVIAATMQFRDGLMAGPASTMATLTALGAATMCPGAFAVGVVALALVLCIALALAVAATLGGAVGAVLVTATGAGHLVAAAAHIARGQKAEARKSAADLAWWQSPALIEGIARATRQVVESADPHTCAKLRQAARPIDGVGTSPPPPPPARAAPKGEHAPPPPAATSRNINTNAN